MISFSLTFFPFLDEDISEKDNNVSFFLLFCQFSRLNKEINRSDPRRKSRSDAFDRKEQDMSRYKSSNSSIRSHLSTASLPKEEVNIVLLGKQNVGKSALVVKYLTKRFIREYDPFLGQFVLFLFS